MHAPLTLALVALLAIGAQADDAPADRQLRTLGEAAQPRFALTDRVWPQKPGEASVCLWRGDALAACSITIDDNSVPDHDWWITQGARTGFRFTWFVIAGQVGTAGAYFGTWEQFAKLRALGHDVQSHTVTHLSFERGFKDIAAEYRESALMIERELPGTRVLTLAYPGGGNSASNSPDVASQFYIAARGGAGHINPANQINYQRTSSIGNLQLDNPKAPWADFLNLFDPQRYRPAAYRGWYCCHFHGMKPELRATTEAALDAIKARGEDVWVGLFREVVQYGQERDTAILTSVSDGDGAFRLTLQDRMDDTLFDHPLTVKVRLPDGWTTASARQNGTSAPVRVIEHDGARFALVELVPDRGDALLRRDPAGTP